jgi:hypothetical protein
MRSLRWILVALLLLGPSSLGADIVLRIPVVTQVTGAVLYRTSLTLGNGGTGGASASVALRLIYRSPVDGTMQQANVNPGPLAANRILVYEDIIQFFKQSGAIRATDANAALFGTLRVTFDADNWPLVDSIAEARTYSAASGGGTNGIAYIGRDVETAGSEVIKAAIRNGSFGPDGTTRANIGFVNESTSETDISVTFRDGSTGSTLRQFTLEDVAPGEVRQLNNVFVHNEIPAGTRTILVRASASNDGRISGYAVQLDSITQDGSFFLFAEEEDLCSYDPPN